MRKIFTLLLLFLVTCCGAQTIRIAFHNGATTTNAMVAANSPTTQGSVVNTSLHTWNNIVRTAGTAGGVSYTAQGLNFSNFALREENGADSLARLEVRNAAGSGFSNNGWQSANKDRVMMEGYYSFGTTTPTSNSLTINNIPASLQAAGYIVTVYADITTARTMAFLVGDGNSTQTLTLAGTAANFAGTFTPGGNVAESSPLSGPTVTLGFDTSLNSDGGVSVLCGLVIRPAPSSITSFTANPSAVAPGGTTTLSWSSTGFQSFTLSPAVGDVTANTSNGSGSVQVAVSSPTTFTLTATGPGGAPVDTRNVSVSILPPTIASFVATPASITSGSSTTLSWQTSGATSVTLSPALGSQSSLASGSLLVSPSVSTLYSLTASNGFASSVSTAIVTVDGLPIPPRISEFVADNKASLQDGDGGYPDWIEIQNLNPAPLDLSGYFLTDNALNPTKWPFPAGTTVPGNGTLVVFASGKTVTTYVDAGGKLHTNFSLTKEGEYLGLTGPAGIVQEFSPAYPRQYEDVSCSPEGFYPTPTPGAPNSGPLYEGIVADTSFSLKRGFYSAPISVALTSATPLASIYYTTDGTAPTTLNGTLYTAPIPVSKTTTLRAAAFRPGWLPTNVDTNTYLFTADIVTQGNTPPGYPANWADHAADYEMDPQVVNDPAYAGQFDAALKALPTLSLVMAPDDMFGANGLYQNPLNEGDAWERSVSAEWISPDGSEPGFQINCGVRIQGGSSRSTDTPKHSLSLRFRESYGSAKLRYNLYPEKTAANEFDLLQLRPEYNHGWMHRHYYQCSVAQYNRDQWASDLFLRMGNKGTHGRWSHLYINGIYWGLYDLQERPDADFMASYFGGEPEEYDTLNSGVVTGGDATAYNAMFAAANGNIADNAVYQTVLGHLDVDAFIDYMLLNFYIGNRDWDGHNWRAGRHRSAAGRFRFFPWDSEFAISPNNSGVITSPAGISGALLTNVTSKNGAGNPSGLHQRLALNAEYRLRFADRVRRHLLDGGALSPASVAATWRLRSDLIDQAIIAESARWGDFRRDVDAGPNWTSSQFALYTKNVHYLPTQDYLLDTYFPQRTGVVQTQLQAVSLYPSVAAPVFSSHGGPISAPFALTVSAPATVHYTLDGGDPRLAGGATSPAALSYTPGSSPPILLTASALVRARTLSGGVWSALTEAYFNASDLRVTELMYHPAGDGLAEFLELSNTGPATVSLAGLRFTEGVAFDFDSGAIRSLAPGGRLLLVRDLAAFQATFGNTHDSLIAGVFQNATALSDSGETLTLSDTNGASVLSLTYGNQAPWPASADGLGHSLVLSGSDTANPAHWRPSALPGGNPGATDSIPYTGGDIISYYLAAPPVADPAASRLSMTRRIGTDQAGHVLETATELGSWSVHTAPPISATPDGNGNETLIYEIPASPRRFFRLRISVP